MTNELPYYPEHSDAIGPLALRLSEGLGPLVEAAGMVNWLNHGAASHVSSEGCNGVTQEHLERFAELVRAAERERCIAECRAVAAAHQDQRGLYQAGREHGADECVRRLEGPN